MHRKLINLSSMKKSALILILLLPFITEAKDFFFNRLEKLHETDQKKCLEVAKRYMKIFPDRSSPHYFASIIYQERSTKSRTIQGQYRNVKKAIGYAMTFEERDEEGIREELDWDLYKSELTKQGFDIAGKLRRIDEPRYSEDLMASLEKFDDNVEIVLVETESESPLSSAPNTMEIVEITDVSDVSEVAERVVFDANSSTEFFGLPTGREFVMSANPNGEQALLALINAEREKLGMVPLEWDEDLARASRYHSRDLATQNYFNHDSHDRRNGDLVKVGGTFDRIRKFYSKTFVNSENIAAGNESPQDTYEQWYNSPGHYDNMFNPNSKKVGLGVFHDEDSPFGYYWTFCTAL